MRITFLVANYAPSVGGAQTLVQRVSEGLVGRHGHRVEVITTDALRPPGGPDPGSIAVRDEVINGVSVRRRPVARKVHTGLRNLRRLGRRAGIYRPKGTTLLQAGPLGRHLPVAAASAARHSDVVVGVSAPFATLLCADLATRFAPAAFVAVPLVHLSETAQPHWVSRSLRRADRCAVNTGAERDWLAGAGVADDRVEVLPPGCDPDLYRPTEASAARASLALVERPTVGFLGRLAAHKGVDTLVAAMSRVWVDRPDVQLLIAGEPTGWDFGAIVDALPVEHRARLTIRTSVPEGDKAMLLAACDVVAFPSSSESFGMVTVEAWCARRPVVACDIPAVRCLLRPGVDGELVPVGDAEALAGAIGSLLADEGRRRRYGEAGRRRAESEFAWDGIVDRWHELLMRSADGRPGASVPRSEGTGH